MLFLSSLCLHLSHGASEMKKSSYSLPLTAPCAKQMLSVGGWGQLTRTQPPDSQLQAFPSEHISCSSFQSYNVKPDSSQSLSSLPCLLHFLLFLACPLLTTPTAPTFPTLTSITVLFPQGSPFVCPSVFHTAAATRIFLEHNYYHISPSLKLFTEYTVSSHSGKCFNRWVGKKDLYQ